MAEGPAGPAQMGVAAGTRSAYSYSTIRLANDCAASERHEAMRVCRLGKERPTGDAGASSRGLRLCDLRSAIGRQASLGKAAQGLWRRRRLGSGGGFQERHLPRGLYGQVRRRRIRPSRLSKEVKAQQGNAATRYRADQGTTKGG